MGRTFKHYLHGDPFFRCNGCNTHLAHSHKLESKNFRSGEHQAFLFSDVVNVVFGPRIDRSLFTGLHTVADIYCLECRSEIGWFYHNAYEESQKYKEGKFILVENKIDEFRVVKSDEDDAAAAASSHSHDSHDSHDSAFDDDDEDDDEEEEEEEDHGDDDEEHGEDDDEDEFDEGEGDDDDAARHGGGSQHFDDQGEYDEEDEGGGGDYNEHDSFEDEYDHQQGSSDQQQHERHQQLRQSQRVLDRAPTDPELDAWYYEMLMRAAPARSFEPE